MFIDDAAAAAFDAGRPAELDVVMASQSSAQAVMQQVRSAVQAAGMDERQLAALTGAGVPEEQARQALDRATALVVVPTVEIVDTDDVAQEFRGLGQFDLGASQQLLLFVFLSPWLSTLVLALFCAVSAAAAMVLGSVMDNDAAASGIGVGRGAAPAGLLAAAAQPEPGAVVAGGSSGSANFRGRKVIAEPIQRK